MPSHDAGRKYSITAHHHPHYENPLSSILKQMLSKQMFAKCISKIVRFTIKNIVTLKI